MSSCSPIDKIRSYRIFGLAIFDWLLALISGLLIGYFILRLTSWIHMLLWIILWFIIGIVVHKILKVPTMLGYYLRLNEKPVEKSC
jgi:type IV secretory pathway TrbD component